MSLVEDLKAERDRIVNQNSCRVCRWVDSQGLEVRAQMEDWINEGLSRKALLRVCQSNGLDVKETAFNTHVRECVLREDICR